MKALASPKVSGLANFFVVGDRFVLDKTARDLGLRLSSTVVDLRNVMMKRFGYGKADPHLGRASVEYLDLALELIGEGKADCLVTAPVNKSSIRSSGLSDFEGHTEYLAHKTRSKEFAMMFVGGSFKITLVTRHIALKDVSACLSADAICRAIGLTEKYLRKYFGLRRPKIGVAGLNPHAGENGSFGKEEARVIMPAIKKASRRISGICGPIPPDVIFNQAQDGKFDAVIAMYHDQALIPFKLLHFKDGVNLTIGLPFIRTSPDHGTAFDIAGKGVADPTSMIEAIRLACRLSAKAAKN